MQATSDKIRHLSINELDAGLEEIRRSPSDHGKTLMIVRRPAVDEREELTEGMLDVGVGLVGDDWTARGSASAPDGGPNPEAQVTIINSRALGLMAQSKQRWSLAGDQIVVDLDLSHENLPPGSRIAIGDAVVEISAKPHTGCVKFAARYGNAALRFVSTPLAMELRLRGANTRVVRSGLARVGDPVVRLPQPPRATPRGTLAAPPR